MELWLQILLSLLLVGVFVFIIWFNPNETVYKKEEVEEKVEKEVVVAEPIKTLKLVELMYNAKEFTEEELNYIKQEEQKLKEIRKTTKDFIERFKKVSLNKMTHRELYNLAKDYNEWNKITVLNPNNITVKEAVKEEDYFNYLYSENYVGSRYTYNYHSYVLNLLENNPYHKYVKETNKNLMKNYINKKLCEKHYVEYDFENEYKYLLEVLDKWRFGNCDND